MILQKYPRKIFEDFVLIWWLLVIAEEISKALSFDITLILLLGLTFRIGYVYWKFETEYKSKVLVSLGVLLILYILISLITNIYVVKIVVFLIVIIFIPVFPRDDLGLEGSTEIGNIFMGSKLVEKFERNNLLFPHEIIGLRPILFRDLAIILNLIVIQLYLSSTIKYSTMISSITNLITRYLVLYCILIVLFRRYNSIVKSSSNNLP